MRIQSITSYGLWNKSTNKKQGYFHQQPSFDGKLTIAEIKKFPLEKKLPHIFDSMSSSDLIAVGKNMEEIKVGIRNAIDEFETLIKRILFIKHGGISVPMVFGRQSENEVFCTNIGNKEFTITTEDDAEYVEPNVTYFIGDGDVIVNSKVKIPISLFGDFTEYADDPDDMNLITNPENFATKVYDLFKNQPDKIVNANKEAFKTLLKSDATKSEKDFNTKKLTFNDVGGMDKVIEALKRSIKYPIQYPFAYQNVSLNRGVLLYGKPGTGKTLLAEALAGECNAEFLKLSGVEFESKYYGETEQKWRNLFSEAKEKQPSIIFIDEFDAVVRERGKGDNNQHSDKVVNQILSLMSDLEKSNDNIFVIATTNKPETIDAAIMRSGRFGKQIEVPVPDKSGLEAILDIHTRSKQLDAELDIDSLLDEMVSRQFTGADVKHIVNEAHTNSWIRSGVYEKMEAGILVPEDMETVIITKADFNKALEDWAKNQTKKARARIGFNK